MRGVVRKLLERMSGEGTDRVLARGASAALMVKAGGAGLGFLVHVVLTRTLGAGPYGDYVYALTWVSLLGLAATAGFDTGAVRFVATYRATKEWSLLRGFLTRSFQIVAAGSCLVALLYFGGVLVTAGSGERGLRSVLLVAAALLPVNALLRLSSSSLQSLKHVVLADAPNLLMRPVLLAAAVLAVAVVSGEVGARDAVLLNLAVAVAALAVSAALLRRRLPGPVHRSKPQHRTRRWLSVGLPLALLSALHVVIRRTDILMVGMLADTTQAGIYTVSVRVAEVAGFGLTAANMIVAPLLSEAHAQEDHDRLQRTFTRGARGAAGFGLAVSLVLVVAGAYVLRVFGPEFTAGRLPMLVLLAGEMISVGAGSVGYLMTMTGHERETARVVGVAAVANVVLNAALIPLWGMLGAAVATGLSMAGWNLVLCLRVRRHLGVTPTVFASLTQ